MRVSPACLVAERLKNRVCIWVAEPVAEDVPGASLAVIPTAIAALRCSTVMVRLESSAA